MSEQPPTAEKDAPRRQYAVIVDPGPATATWGRYVARVERGTIESYHPGSTNIDIRRPSARWAKRVAERAIRRIEASEQRAKDREIQARRVTGYNA